MRLYLVQHAAAKTEAEDPQRGLTDEGRLAVESKGWQSSWLRSGLRLTASNIATNCGRAKQQRFWLHGCGPSKEQGRSPA